MDSPNERVGRSGPDAPRPYAGDADWLQPSTEADGPSRYAGILRERWWLIVAAVAITTGFALFYVSTAEETYEAEADMLISPIDGDDSVLSGLNLIQSSSDPTRDVETAARLITTPDVAAEVAEQTNYEGDDPNDLLDDVDAAPVAQSNIVSITAQAGTGEEAAELANAFADGVIAVRTENFQREVKQQIKTLRGEVEPGSSLQPTLERLRVLRNAEDPTFEIATRATVPGSPVAPQPTFSVIAGILLGLVLGIGGAFAMQMVDPRLRREEQLRSSYKLPILARIPTDPAGGTGPLGPQQVDAATTEAYRTLRGTLSAAGAAGGSRAVLVTGSASGEGKTTTAMNLAAALASAGRSVILVESDLRSPDLGQALGVRPGNGVVSVLIQSAGVEQALVGAPGFGSTFRLLLAERSGPWTAELFSLPAAEQLISDCRALADYVIIDSPPLTDVVDALPLARYADDVLIVSRLGHTQLNRLETLAELLAESDVKPTGFAVVGSSGAKRDRAYVGDRGSIDGGPRFNRG